MAVDGLPRVTAVAIAVAAAYKAPAARAGEVPERSIGAVSKTVVRHAYRGFESHPLRQSPIHSNSLQSENHLESLPFLAISCGCHSLMFALDRLKSPLYGGNDGEALS